MGRANALQDGLDLSCPQHSLAFRPPLFTSSICQSQGRLIQSAKNKQPLAPGAWDLSEACRIVPDHRGLCQWEGDSPAMEDDSILSRPCFYEGLFLQAIYGQNHTAKYTQRNAQETGRALCQCCHSTASPGLTHQKSARIQTHRAAETL